MELNVKIKEMNFSCIIIHHHQSTQQKKVQNIQDTADKRKKITSWVCTIPIQAEPWSDLFDNTV